MVGAIISRIVEDRAQARHGTHQHFPQGPGSGMHAWWQNNNYAM